MKQYLFIFLSWAFCKQVFSQTTSYYGHDMLMVVREEASDKKYNTIQLAGDIIIRDYDNAPTEYAINDHLESTRTVIDDKLTSKLSCDYDAYGNISNDVPLELRDKCRYSKTYKWSNTAQMYQSPTRAYQPIAKRFLSMDPYRQTYSPYTYTTENPIRYLDPSGSVIIQDVSEIVQEIRQMDIFQQLAGMPSDTRELFPMIGDISRNRLSAQQIARKDEVANTIGAKVHEMRNEVMSKARNEDISLADFAASGQYRDIVVQHGVANCQECAFVMLGELANKYPSANVEVLQDDIEPNTKLHVSRTEGRSLDIEINHGFTVFNRDYSTTLHAPETWNPSAVVVDAWAGVVMTRDGFITARNTPGHVIYNTREIHPNAIITPHPLGRRGDEDPSRIWMDLNAAYSSVPPPSARVGEPQGGVVKRFFSSFFGGKE